MREFLERYKVRIETIGPVHIGSGESLRKTQWILDYKENAAVMIDFSKFVDFLMKRKLLDDYEAYLMSPKPIPLFKWLSAHGIYSNEIKEFAAYTLDVSGLNLKNGQIKDMQLAVKDPYGLPYIPGSSLKGVIRNALLASKIREKGYDGRSIVNEIKTFSGKEQYFLNREKGKLEQDIFHTKDIYKEKHHAVNDVMSGIRISDSTPIGLECLTLCQKIDVKPDGKEAEIPLVRECIKPDTVLEFELTIDRTETRITIEEIKEAIQSFLEDYNDMFLRHFRDEEQYRGNVVYLGGGTGFPTKTVLNQILKAEKDRVRLVAGAIDKTLPRKMKRHSQDHIKGVSPTAAKLTEIDGTLLQMGACKVDFTAV